MMDFEKEVVCIVRDCQLEVEIVSMFEDWEVWLDLVGLDLFYGVMKGFLSYLFESYLLEDIVEFLCCCVKIFWDQVQMIDLNILQENLY